MVKNIKIILVSFLLLFVSGCGSPKNSEYALMGFWGTYSVFFIALCTIFFYYHFKNKKPRSLRKNFSNFRKNNKFLFWTLLGLIIFSIFLSTIMDVSDALTSDNSQENLEYSVDKFFDAGKWVDNLLSFGIVGLFLLVYVSIPIIIYSLLLIFLFNRTKNLSRFIKYIPLVITLVYIITLFIVLMYDNGSNTGKSLLVIWLWPAVFLFGG